MGSNRRPIKCRYFGTRKGCRAGDSCPYTHDALSLETPTVRPAHPDDDIHVTLTNREDIFLSASGRDEFSSQRGQAPAHAPDQVPAPMSSQRPISRLQLESPREFQLSQIRRRFQPEERSDENATYLTFTMTPTDPDFSHAINGLECLLHIPKGYPMQGKPSLEIKNENLSAVSKAIVEERFFQLANSQISMGLLQMMNVLDRDLEDALVGKRTGPECPTDTRTLNRSQRPTDSKGDDFDPKRRSREVAQLQSRLGRDRLFSANPDGLSFTVPVRPVRPDLLPASLKQLSAVNLFVPASYPANPCQLSIAGINDEVACYVEISFDKHVRNNPGMSLISHINYLSAMMHNMIIPPTDENVGISSAAVDQLTREENELPSTSAVGSGATPVPAKPVDAQDSRQLEDRSHIHIIPRPPEWSTQYDAYNEDESEYSDDFASEASFSDDGDEGGVRIPETHQSQTGKQVLLSFPSLELHGIELLELKSVSLTLKCERCKDTCDVQNLKIGENGISVPPERVQTCGKCASYLTVGFRRELMHQNSNRAGIVHLDGCTAVDLLPSNFYPVCSQCSSTYPAPGIVAVRGDTRTVVCRGCHNEMYFKIPELKFLLISTAQESTSLPPRAARKPKETLGIVAGQELPQRGRCIHYGKSYRWFRFSCCSKVFPCDKCHDSVSDHPNEHANRMICGFCSREQTYHPEVCSVCHATLIGKRGGGFWEGGKGTRDKKLMSRKDPRKYKRRGANPSGSSSRK